MIFSHESSALLVGQERGEIECCLNPKKQEKHSAIRDFPTPKLRGERGTFSPMLSKPGAGGLPEIEGEVLRAIEEEAVMGGWGSPAYNPREESTSNGCRGTHCLTDKRSKRNVVSIQIRSTLKSIITTIYQ